ncbi:hypothetical protein A2154_03005 [Candidatus Gottesmanbacteria bacterium RBG_16_43_7]|uniref:Cation-transporting P-type ATPase C-terminal domain-containing protein n=1 Tax=Candidatus Gottesmanbacteria bacterium RBG_16_43_7 TaxID=1798373 RepID=A0A1F5Z8Z3_9BACT|nr:MAG: hypothetical protein A2154_03005 [Candidatus Gottesmanbacteria bacterium RBG_16_43_7]
MEELYEVGFLGEGINDAPALKAANVALAVDHASDIARDVSDIVLLKRDLSYIIDGIREGRRILVNNAKYITTTLASNFGNFYAVAVISLLVPYLPMLPVQILLVNLLSDFPMISIATDSVHDRELAKPIRYDLREILILSIVLGLVSSVFDFIFFGIFRTWGESTLQTGWFIESIITEILLIYAVRNKAFILQLLPPSGEIVFMTIVAIAATVLIPFTGMGQQIFQFVTLNNQQLLLIAGIAASYFFTSECVKMMYFKLIHTPHLTGKNSGNYRKFS